MKPRYSGMRITPCESWPIRLLVISESTVAWASSFFAPAEVKSAMPASAMTAAGKSWLMSPIKKGDAPLRKASASRLTDSSKAPADGFVEPGHQFLGEQFQA